MRQHKLPIFVTRGNIILNFVSLLLLLKTKQTNPSWLPKSSQQRENREPIAEGICASLSSFAYAPMYIDGRAFATAEHAFSTTSAAKVYRAMFDMTSKTYIGDDPKVAKKCGGRAFFKKHGFTLRPDWDNIRLVLMTEILDERDLQNDASRRALAATGRSPLVHRGFRIDRFWGSQKQRGGHNHHGRFSWPSAACLHLNQKKEVYFNV